MKNGEYEKKKVRNYLYSTYIEGIDTNSRKNKGGKLRSLSLLKEKESKRKTPARLTINKRKYVSPLPLSLSRSQ